MTTSVKPGYKQTEVGVIPDDWDAKPLVLLAQVRSGVPKNANVKVNDPISVHYLRVANVQDGFLDLAEMSEIVIERSDLRRFAVLPGDVLMNEGGDRDKLGRGCVWDGQFNPCVHQNHVFVVRCTKQLYPQFLAAWTQTAVAKVFFVNAGSQTTNLASINKTALGRLPVLLPPTLAEQKAIAAALSDADRLIESLEKLIAKKRQIKHGTMQELLTGKRRLPGFSGKWETVRAGDVGRFRGGSGFPTKFQGRLSGDFPFFKVSDMNKEGNDTFMRSANNYVTEATRKIIGAVLFPEHSVVFAKVGAAVFLERKKILARTSCLDNNMAAFILDADRADFHFVHFLMLNMRLGDLVSTTALPALSGKTLSEIELTLPPHLNEQVAIAEVLSDIDLEIAAFETKLAKARQLKQGMMQELLTGRTRLI